MEKKYSYSPDSINYDNSHNEESSNPTKFDIGKLVAKSTTTLDIDLRKTDIAISAQVAKYGFANVVSWYATSANIIVSRLLFNFFSDPDHLTITHREFIQKFCNGCNICSDGYYGQHRSAAKFLDAIKDLPIHKLMCHMPISYLRAFSGLVDNDSKLLVDAKSLQKELKAIRGDLSEKSIQHIAKKLKPYAYGSGSDIRQKKDKFQNCNEEQPVVDSSFLDTSNVPSSINNIVQFLTDVKRTFKTGTIEYKQLQSIISKLTDFSLKTTDTPTKKPKVESEQMDFGFAVEGGTGDE